MPYIENDSQILSLSELNGLVKDTVELTLVDTYWVRAELASVHESRGHCYMELVEYTSAQIGGVNRTPVAQSRACCWAGTWVRLSPKFLKVAGEPLRSGMNVLLCVKANFHIAYGFSWLVVDIDPTFTMGDMARRKQEIIKILKEEGVFDLNKQLEIPMFCKRIAVISSETAAGYGDFCNHLQDNEYGFMFETRLFPATMQGEQVEPTVIAALERIYDEVSEGKASFDAVVIIRGGGSTTDLSGFDTLALAENVANFPLPVITGIGHERDQSVLDLVACVSVKTPTAVAAFLIDNMAQTLEQINDAADRISSAVRHRLDVERMRISSAEQYLSSAFTIRKKSEENKIADLNSRIISSTRHCLLKERNNIESFAMRLPLIISAKIDKEKHRLQLMEQRTKAVDPINILKRGYSIILHNGHAVTDASKVDKGDEVTVIMAKGQCIMKVEE